MQAGAQTGAARKPPPVRVYATTRPFGRHGRGTGEIGKIAAYGPPRAEMGYELVKHTRIRARKFVCVDQRGIWTIAAGTGESWRKITCRGCRGSAVGMGKARTRHIRFELISIRCCRVCQPPVGPS